jgi:Flp pilus assembly pilin Flp
VQRSTSRETSNLITLSRLLRRRFIRRHLTLLRDESGAVTAEYSIVILAAVAFAGLLVAIMRSDEVRAMLVALVQNALGAAG